MNLHITARDGLAFQSATARLWVKWYTTAAIGGPEAAELVAEATDLNDLLELLRLLRAEVMLYTADGYPAWWGYVHEVELIEGQWGAGVTLETMFNKAAVQFMQAVAGKTTMLHAMTAFDEDAASVAEFGKKGLIASANWATVDQATALRSRLIEEHKRAGALQRFYPNPQPTHAVLRCRGWWNTLAWDYYVNDLTTETDTLSQAEAIAIQTGQFLSAVVRQTTSGIVTNSYRDGKGTGAAEIGQILKLGAVAGARLLARVLDSKVLLLYQKPSSSAPYVLKGASDLFDSLGNPFDKSLMRAGQWLRLARLPYGLDATRYDDPTLFFIEHTRYNLADDRLELTPETTV